jgi:hypothetical protein
MASRAAVSFAQQAPVPLGRIAVRKRTLVRRGVETEGRLLMPAFVVVHLAKRASRRERARRGPLARVQRLAAAHGGVLLPPSADAANAQGAEVITVSLDDMERANALAAALRELEDVTTAYAKPAEELP